MAVASGFSLLLVLGSVAGERELVRAELERLPPAVSAGGLELRSVLERRADRSPFVSARFELSAVLQPKATPPICWGPGHVFADGYEGP
ncbi:MAG: hypothetical protein RML12_08770 [Xanthomonadales bacterium]|nr:hypothetical protein [Xanthomonadales bacterium]